MPDTRRHRGPAPGDDSLFDRAAHPHLAGAVADLGWLLSRGYRSASALKLVGDRYGLKARQRRAVERCACTDDERDARAARRVEVEALSGRHVDVDGFNVLITCESVLSGAPVFLSRDGALRDIASVHGTWRRVSETQAAVGALGELLAPARSVVFWLDRPVSNSGRLAGILRDTADAHGWPWSVELADHVDPILGKAEDVVATADSWILDRARAWVDLPATLARAVPAARLMDLRSPSSPDARGL